MTNWYTAKCLCDNEFKIPKGGGWTWIQSVCDSCGDYLNIPRNLPADRDISESELLRMLSEDKRLWPRYGRTFKTDSEEELFKKHTRTCKCGGKYIRESENGATYRCPNCKSNIFKWLQIGELSD